MFSFIMDNCLFIPIIFSVASTYDYPSASEVTLKNTGEVTIY